MRPVTLGSPIGPPSDEFQRWVRAAFNEIERASYDDMANVFNDFTVTGHTDTRTLDAGTAVLADVVNVLCTLIEDMKSRGMKRGT